MHFQDAEGPATSTAIAFSSNPLLLPACSIERQPRFSLNLFHSTRSSGLRYKTNCESIETNSVIPTSESVWTSTDQNSPKKGAVKTEVMASEWSQGRIGNIQHFPFL